MCGMSREEVAACTFPELRSIVAWLSGDEKSGGGQAQNKNDSLALKLEAAMQRTGKRRFKLHELI